MGGLPFTSADQTGENSGIVWHYSDNWYSNTNADNMAVGSLMSGAQNYMYFYTGGGDVITGLALDNPAAACHFSITYIVN